MDTTYTRWTDLKSKIENELDLNEETFITAAELIQYANSGIEEAEKMVMELYQDYFLASFQPTIVTGTADYVMPTSIWGNKIRMVVFSDGQSPPVNTYRMRRIPLHKVPFVGTNDDYQFLLTQAPPTTTDGPADGGIRFKVVPTPRSDMPANGVTIWYLRFANRVVDDTSQIDIPEATAFIEWYIRVKVYRKEGHFLLQDAVAELEKQRQILRESLDSMAPDEEECLEPDMSFYVDFYSNGYNGGQW